MHDSGAQFAILTHSERQIWLGQRLHPGSPLYNMAFGWVFDQELRAELFAQAWRQTVDANPALRAKFNERDSGPNKTFFDPGCSDVEVLDWSARSEAEREFRTWTSERAERPLPLDGPLLDSVLVKLGAGKTGWYLNQHHLIADARSTVLLFREMGRRYEALADGGVAEFAETADPSPAVISGKGEIEAAREHWRRRMGGPNRAVPMYGKEAAPAGTLSRRCTIELDRETSERLQALCEQPGFASISQELSRLTLLSTVLTSWLHRISERSQIGLDAPVAGRRSAREKQATGLFIEMFPYTVELEPGESFRSLAGKCLQEAILFLRHALPGLSAPSAASASNVVLNYFPESFGLFAGVQGVVEWVHSGHGDDVHALRVQVHDLNGTGRWVIHLDFNESVFPEALRRRSMRHFEANLHALIENPDRRIATVDIRTDKERSETAERNDVWSVPTPSRSVLHPIWELAQAEPNSDALHEGERRLNRRELIARAEGLAATLAAAGVHPGDRVAIVAKRSIEAVVAILAVLRARAAYVPVDPAYPPTRIRKILRDSGARLALTTGSLDGVEDLGVRTLPVDSAAEAVALDSEMPGLDDLAYVLYTSGSTGEPKGVMIEHGGLADYLEWAARTYVRGDRLTFPLFTSLSFDLTVTSLFLPLMTGGVVEIYPEPDGPVDSTLQEVVRENKVDFLKATPSHLSLMTRMGLGDSKIRRVVAGGENLKTSLAEQVQTQLGPEAEIYNEYGPTEAVVGCVLHRYRASEEDAGGSVPIGLPADHVEVEVMNEALTPTPTGVPGELWVTRFGLARGYHGLDELTVERFRPMRELKGKRWYRTGDRVRISGAGRLEYLGRIDRQLKIAGHRVEPDEIESAMLELPEIEQCAVVRRRRASADADVFCVSCGLPSNFPDVSFDQDGVCRTCRSYDVVKEHARGYFKTMDDLHESFRATPPRSSSQYDCMMLLSGGKDSTFALCKLVEMGLSVYAFTLDNGYISDGAKANIRRVTSEFGVPVEFATTPAMNAIFRDSLARHANVCQGCFKTLYTLSVNRAVELGISTIVTGLSRGQMFETRLTEEMFRGGARSTEEVDAAVLAARKVYHRADDEVKRSLDVRVFEDDSIFERIRFVDFFRYCDVGLSEMLAYLGKNVPWIRPDDTGRSTNCLINDVGIFVHKRQRGFHNYALPYSWDVRMGHKTRDEALGELDDVIDPGFVRRTLQEIGCDPNPLMDARSEWMLAAFYVGGTTVAEDEIRAHLADRLPRALIPTHFERIESIPLTAHGKVDERALPQVVRARSEQPFRDPEGPVAEYLAGVWAAQLNVDCVGADDDFFGLGGTSLAAMEVMIRLCQEFEIELPLDTVFLHPRLEDLARVAEDRILSDTGLDGAEAS